jgi:Protein of unknown function (DUF2889)
VQFQLPDPSGPAPLRRPHSIRRTSSIDMTWPRGRHEAMAFRGVGRDIYTAPDGGAPVVVHQDEMTATVASDRTILAIASEPPRDGIERLVGAKGGGYLREVLVKALPDEQRTGSPLFLLLDDLSGTSLIARWAWSRWPDDGVDEAEQARRYDEARHKMEDVCIGFRRGSSALEPRSSQRVHRAARVGPLVHPDDPAGWHALVTHHGVSMRRARRIDVWVEDNVVVEGGFQDSASEPDGGRIAVHEYSLRVVIDRQDLTIRQVQARPNILPFPECPAAIDNLSRLEGTPLAALRTRVLEQLPRTLGCTHLNDAVRALAEVPGLLYELASRSSSPAPGTA